MKKKTPLLEDFNSLEEVIRQLDYLITPVTTTDEMDWLLQRDMRQKLFETFPKCVLSLMVMEKTVPFFPVCNRMGMHDPKMIRFSMDMVEKMKNLDDIDHHQLEKIGGDLKILLARFDKPIPKPPEMATRKAILTKQLDKLKSVIRSLKGEE